MSGASGDGGWIQEAGNWPFPHPNRDDGVTAPLGFCVVPKVPTLTGIHPQAQWPAGWHPAQAVLQVVFRRPAHLSPLLLSTWQQTAGMHPVSFLSVTARQLRAHFVLSQESRCP